MTSRVSSKNKGKQVKRKNSVNYRDETEKNGTTRKQKTASPGVEPVLSARALNQTFDKFLMVTSTCPQPLRLF